MYLKVLECGGTCMKGEGACRTCDKGRREGEDILSSCGGGRCACVIMVGEGVEMCY